MQKCLVSSKKVFFLILLILSLIYVIISIFKVGYVIILFLVLPIPGIVGFLYGNWSGSEKLSFLIGFIPIFIFFRLMLLQNPEMSSGSLIIAFLLGFCSGIIGYSGARKNKGNVDWILFILLGMFLWVIIVTPGMRS